MIYRNCIKKSNNSPLRVSEIEVREYNEPLDSLGDSRMYCALIEATEFDRVFSCDDFDVKLHRTSFDSSCDSSRSSFRGRLVEVCDCGGDPSPHQYLNTFLYLLFITINVVATMPDISFHYI